MATQVKKRLTFARAHLDKTPAAWKSELQAVGDIKEFTYYPRDLRPKLAQLRAPWTYMTAAEKRSLNSNGRNPGTLSTNIRARGAELLFFFGCPRIFLSQQEMFKSRSMV